MTKLTVKDLLALKGKRQLTEVYVRNAKEAAACEAAGIDLIITSEHSDTAAIRAAAPNTFFTIGLSYGDYASPSEAIRGGFRAWWPAPRPRRGGRRPARSSACP